MSNTARNISRLCTLSGMTQAFRMPRGRDTTPRPVWGAREVKDALPRDDFRKSQLSSLSAPGAKSPYTY